MMMEEILTDSSIYQWRMEEGEKAGYKKGYRIGVQRSLTLLTATSLEACPIPA